MKIRILRAAVDDLAAGRDFYESQECGLGQYFLDALSADLNSLILYAGIHESHGKYYKMLSKRFPYAIYYRIADDETTTEVWRILDCRQNPVRTKRALE